jgi:MFS family permease
VTAPRTAVRRLATARIISITGGGAAYAALNFTIYERTGSAAWVAAALLLTFGVVGFVAPPAGMLGDRFDRRIVMIVSDLVGAACFGAMALGQDPAWLLVWAFLSAVAEAPFWSASEAAIPNVAGLEHLSWANSLLGVSRSAGITLGPALGGALLALWSASAVFAINAVSFLVSALIIATVHTDFAGEREHEEEYRGLRAGFAFLWHDRVLRTLILAWIVFISGMGMSMVADAPLAAVFGAGSFGYGMLITAWGGGATLGSLYARRMRLGAEGTWLVVSGSVIAAMGIAIGFSPSFVLIVVLLFGMGLADGTTFVAEQNLRQRRAPDAVRSRVSAAFTGVLHVMLALSYVAAAVVVPWIGAQPTYAVGGVTAGLAVIVLVRMRRLLSEDEAARAVVEPGGRARLRREPASRHVVRDPIPAVP